VDRHSLNILIRRVEIIRSESDDPETEENCRKCLYHLDALYTRRGRIHKDDEIALDSKGEQRIILQAMGLAGIKEARAGFWKEKWDATKRWLWKKVKGVVLHSLPWGVIAVWLWCSRKRLRRAVFQYDRRVEQLDDEVRHSFRGKDLEREHARIKRNGV